MKNKYRKTIAYTTIILLLGVAVAPISNALMVTKNVDENTEETTNYGSISGNLYYYAGSWLLPRYNLDGAKVDIGIKKTWSDKNGNYKLKNLPLDTTYTLVVTCYGFKKETKTVYLSKYDPHLARDFQMIPSDRYSKAKIDKTEETTNYGSISGHIACQISQWGMLYDCSGAFVDAEIKCGFSHYDGNYELSELPLDRTYKVTVMHTDYKSETKTVHLSSDDPNKIVDFELIYHAKTYDLYNVEIDIYGRGIASSLLGTVNFGVANAQGYIKTADSCTNLNGNTIVGQGYFTKIDHLNVDNPYIEIKGTALKLTLTPDEKLNIKSTSKILNKEETEDSSCGGTIYGYTIESHDTWGAYPVPFALVDAGIKQTISGPVMGNYRITGLPLNQEITITASKRGYDSDTIKHTFTEGNPEHFYCFDLQEKENYPIVKQKSFTLFEKLFSLIPTGSNTWSNLLSTFAFMT